MKYSMTIHAACTFFDKENMDYGYVIGSDSRYDFGDEFGFFGEKSFRGKNYIGVFMGAFPRVEISTSGWKRALRALREKGDAADEFKTIALANLDDVFDGLSVGKNYSHLEALRNVEARGKTYSLLIASRRDSNMELHVITNEKIPRLEEGTAYLLHALSSDYQPEKTNLWFLGPSVPRSSEIVPRGYVEDEERTVFNLKDAAGLIRHRFLELNDPEWRKLLVWDHDGYDPGKASMFVVSSQRLGRLEDF